MALKIWLRPLPFALVAAYGLARATHASVDDAAPSRSAALCASLAEIHGVTCNPEDVVWIAGPRGVVGAMRGSARALVRGRGREAPSAADDAADDRGAAPDEESLDIFAVDARLSPEGQLLDVGDAHNLTRTSGADEDLPITRGSLVAYLVEVDGQPEAVHVLDLDGHDPHAYDDMTRLERIQVKLADLQATGRARGVKRTIFSLMPPPKTAVLAFRPDGMLEIRTTYGAEGPRTIAIDPVHGTAPDTASIRVSAEIVAKPPTLAPWMSDRLRAVSWFGDEKNQALKAIVFTTMEWVKNEKAALTGDTGEKAAEEDLGSLAANQANRRGPTTFVDPESGWPPKPLEPIFKPALPGEGQWIRLDDDPFITPIPGLPSPFVTTFVRSDPSAQQTRVYVTLWDPRLVALHMEAGTVEPVSATGEAGPGQIPRTPETLRRVVAGFNGGFQATHGEFGMQADGVLYLPPKPYAATVMELWDGTTAFGAWPKEAGVPEEVLSFRQNMTFMVQNDKYNPWGRPWWGGVPPGWHDAIHTTRSGLCLTKEGFVAYLFGHDIGPEPLGKAMLAARCAEGIHLDMNPGLAGFEFYNMQSASTFKPLGRPLQPDWEYEGTMKDMPDFKFRARRMTRNMGHILFPRYIQRDARDFFYLTVRSVLPGTPLPGAAGPEDAWRVKGLPHHGYPYASAIASVRLGLPGAPDRRARVLRLDPRTLRLGDANADDASTVAVLGRARPAIHPKPGDAPPPVVETERKVWLGSHVFTIDRSPPPGGVAVAPVLPPGAAAAATARAAVGVLDEDGTLEWIELPPEDAPSAAASDAMLALLAQSGCTARALVPGDLRAFLGGSLDLAAQPAAPAQVSVRFVRTPSPAAKTMFDSTPIVPQSVWQPLQSQRVKWRPTLAPPEKPASSSSAASSSTPPQRPR